MTERRTFILTFKALEAEKKKLTVTKQQFSKTTFFLMYPNENFHSQKDQNFASIWPDFFCLYYISLTRLQFWPTLKDQKRQIRRPKIPITTKNYRLRVKLCFQMRYLQHAAESGYLN